MKEEKEQVSIEDFVIPAKLHAFLDNYTPARNDQLDAIEFDDIKLRSFFKAYVTTHGDPLRWYIDNLVLHGFSMTISIISSEPVIRVMEKFV